MSKTKVELLKEAKSYFDAYPKEQEIHTTGDGNFFLNSNKSAAKTHERQTKGELMTITRSEVEATDGQAKQDVVIPEGEPSKEWTREELFAYGEREYPDLKIAKNSKEDTILSKLAEAKSVKQAAEKAAQEPEK